MEVLNVALPPDVSHKKLVSMSRYLCLMDYKFRPVGEETEFGQRSVRDIVEYQNDGVRFIVMEDEELEPCTLIIEFLDKDTRRPGGRPGMHFDMRRTD